MYTNKDKREGMCIMKNRGFEKVSEIQRKNHTVFTDEKGRKHSFPLDVTLPTRADSSSAGYDFYVPKDTLIYPSKDTLIWTDVKAYMGNDEVLKIYIRSSLAVKHGLTLSNNTGIIDSSYYDNKDNEGNIGISIKNNSGKTYELVAGERIAQGIFINYLCADEEEENTKEREGGFGSSGK